MAERVAQLQDLVMEQAENIWTSISVIEQFSEPYIFKEIERRKVKLSKKERLKMRLEAEKMKEKNDKEHVEKNVNENVKDEKPSIDYPYHFAKRVTEVAKDINTLIDSLPDDSLLSPDLQVKSLKRFEEENMKLAKQLEEQVLQGENLLEKIRISSNFLSSENLKTFFPE
ncbi:mediator of RNA polymerase II transcription subunit 21-like [Lycorma delicatula]|uniref:mediator of RNA polymerase II transcription subunit 21-like n=1 Tax=Lycorma delicatula TaxID=130591 RepID=UPI003F5152AB